MYGSFANSKNRMGYTLAFVGTLDKDFTKIYSFCQPGYKSRESIPQSVYYQIFTNWARNFVMSNSFKGP
jgi:hypothetical protein